MALYLLFVPLKTTVVLPFAGLGYITTDSVSLVTSLLVSFWAMRELVEETRTVFETTVETPQALLAPTDILAVILLQLI
ncbi:hypothetical protein QTN47_22670 [Danxiaibacter flavus]|uniref:Uncharacterized protein n=1 Tax=Danxiaibacter flavus TaxID=3049108 RepID=A0ABV3ZKB8_9BACT|nr:hypothetical protein QNM32_22675 [Chitinophagaceae bacterium DXS]